MHVYRVWFTDGSAVLIEADTPQEAMEKADKLAEAGQYIKRTELLR